jgi:hypothetical protein
MRKIIARIGDSWVWGPFGAVLGMIAIALAVLIAMGDVFASSPPPLSVGQAGRSGALEVTLTSVECNKGLADLSSELRKHGPPTLPPSQQLCFVNVRLHNVSTSEQPPTLEQAVLYVNQNEYLALVAEPPFAPLLLQGAETKTRGIFIVPKELIPTRVTIKADPSGGKLDYNLNL